jgi:hypothetical protein
VKSGHMLTRVSGFAGLHCERLQLKRLGALTMPWGLREGGSSFVSEEAVDSIVDAGAVRSVLINRVQDMVLVGTNVHGYRIPSSTLRGP